MEDHETRIRQLEEAARREAVQAEASRVVGINEVYREVIAVRAVQQEQGLATGRIEAHLTRQDEKIDDLRADLARVDAIQADVADVKATLVELVTELRQGHSDAPDS